MKPGRSCHRCVEGKLGMGEPCPDCAGTGYATKSDQARYTLEAPGISYPDEGAKA